MKNERWKAKNEKITSCQQFLWNSTISYAEPKLCVCSTKRFLIDSLLACVSFRRRFRRAQNFIELHGGEKRETFETGADCWWCEVAVHNCTGSPIGADGCTFFNQRNAIFKLFFRIFEIILKFYWQVIIKIIKRLALRTLLLCRFFFELEVNF